MTIRKGELFRNSDILFHVPRLRALAGECEGAVVFEKRDDEVAAVIAEGVQGWLDLYSDKALNLSRVEAVVAERAIDFAFDIGSSHSVAIEPCDLLYLNLKHTYTHLRRELLRYCRDVNTYIIIPSTWVYGLRGEDRSEPGLELAIQEFLGMVSGWEVDFVSPRNNGLTVLKRGD